MRQDRVRKASPELVQSARLLRRRQTAAEARLWEAIRGQRAFPHRVRRQHAVRSFVLDFWIPAARIAVEIDGGIHDVAEIAAQDAERMALIEAYDAEVVRFRNDDILNDLDRVLSALIDKRMRELSASDTR